MDKHSDTWLRIATVRTQLFANDEDLRPQNWQLKVRAACSKPRPGDVQLTARPDRGHTVGREEVERRSSLERVLPLEVDLTRDYLLNLRC